MRLGRYSLAECIGRGAMGHVFAATDDQAGRRVAVRLGTAGDLRVHHQARVTGQVSHPNVVSILDLGEAGSRPFVVMELVDGRPLDDGGMAAVASLDARLDLMTEVCDGLHAAHARQVVHGHLKPSHVFVTPDGVKLNDFGAGLGRPDAYASPEEVNGLPATPRSDIFSAAAVFYFLLTGRAPFSSNRAVVSDQPPALTRAEAPDALARVLYTAMDKDPDRRQQSVNHLRAEIAQVRVGRRGEVDRVLRAAIDRYRAIETLVAERRALGRRLGLAAIERECDERLARLASAFSEFARSGLEFDGLSTIDAGRASEALAQLQVWHNEVAAEVSVLKTAAGERA